MNFTFFGSYWEATQGLSDDDQGKMYKAIIDYAMTGIEPQLEGTMRMIYVLIKPNIDKSICNARNRAHKRTAENDCTKGLQKTTAENDCTKGTPPKDKDKEREKDKDKGERKENICESLSKIKSKYPDKVGNVVSVPDWLDADKLLFELDSSEFLRNNNNLDLEWYCDRKNYDKVLSGYYRDYIGAPRSSDEAINLQQRDYDQHDLEKLFSAANKLEV